MTMMKNILIYFDHPVLPTQGGTERTSFLLANLLKTQGCQVYFLSLFLGKDSCDMPFPQYSLPESHDLMSVTNTKFTDNLCRDLNIDAILNEGAHSGSSYFFSHNHLTTDAQIISIINFSIWEGLNHFYALIPKRFNTVSNSVKTTLRILSAPWKKHVALKNKRHKFQHLIEYSDKVVVLSPHYIQDLLTFASSTDRQKLYAIPNLLSYDIQPLPTPGNKQNTILYVGRLSEADKRVDRLLKIWKRLQHKYKDWTLKIVGDGDAQEDLEQKASQYGLERILFLGRNNPVPFYQEAKILCITSTHEGMPMVINEALAYGCTPVVFNSFHAAEDMIPDEKTGRLVTPFNLTQFAAALEALMAGDYTPPCTNVLGQYRPELIAAQWKQCLEEPR